MKFTAAEEIRLGENEWMNERKYTKKRKRFNNVQDFMRNKKEINTTPVSRVSIESMFV